MRKSLVPRCIETEASDQNLQATHRERVAWVRKFWAAKSPDERAKLWSTFPFDGVRAGFSAFPRGTSSAHLIRGSSVNTQGGIELILDKDVQSFLSVKDDKGRNRAVLGSTSLKITRPGVGGGKAETEEKRPESSLVLFDKKGKVIWSAP